MKTRILSKLQNIFSIIKNNMGNVYSNIPLISLFLILLVFNAYSMFFIVMVSLSFAIAL